ncbi:hypothetical protein A2480_03015 [Candidatus Uhrbacteria bacterium RIFOXYC2_FULL_47_19]|uniref:Uncharacterized protein n=1 Tax=Candidatus Uhrbacteria bacterium RIFOXYC2_FULL_47_19 TaxID=1802424 RepID=A0A1F7WEZ8_9BACT|nr:MAG: hypothetical protein A2480_03015 [Candidatus Uhrbacteria bacterium RIFOXYC2_FULL_47_19]HCC22119.1 hypothetical protein [Candidatus Uhrbacteria bacterium]
MGYLIGGPSRCGKTTLTKKLYPRAKAGFVSTDDLKHVFMSGMPKADWSRRFPLSSQVATKKGQLNIEQFTSREIISAVESEARTIWPAVRWLIEKRASWGDSYVVEGIHLLPSLITQLRESEVWNSIRLMYLVKTDKEAIKKGFEKGGRDDLHKLRNTETLERSARLVSDHSVQYVAEMEKFELDHVDVSKGFTKKIDEVCSRLLGV